MTRKLTPVAIILIVLGMWQLWQQAPTLAAVSSDQWGMTDWLVNYEGGFVRRGLGGFLLYHASQSSQIAANHLAVIVSVIGFLILLIWLYRKATEFFPLAFLFSCAVLGFPVYQYTIVRKDCILLLLLISCLTILRGGWKSWIQWSVVNLSCCCGVLLHETFAFIAFPAIVLTQQSLTFRMMWQRMCYLIPALGCFVVVVFHHGDASTARAIHDSWQGLWIQSNLSPEWLQQPFATIQSIGWTTEQGLLQTKGLLQNGLYQPTAWFCVLLLTFMASVRFLESRHQSKLAEWLQILIFQLICVAPLFLLGVDYGRWIFLWIVSSIILFSSGYRLPQKIAHHALFQSITNRLVLFISYLPRKEWLLLFFGLPILWGLMNFVNASPAGRFLWEMYSLAR
jgi:hypothetical protein